MEHESIAGRLKADCPHAWATFYRAHLDPVWRFAYRRLGGCRDTADEVASETFLAAVESIGRYDPAAGSLERWLFGVARRKVADRLRARYRQRLRLAEQPFEDVPDRAGPDQRAPAADDVRRRVALTLKELPALHRDALVWMYQDALTVRQIAARLNRTEKAAANLLYRARQRFKEAYRAAVDIEMEGEHSHEPPIAQADR